MPNKYFIHVYLHAYGSCAANVDQTCLVFFPNSEACHIKALSESFNGYFRIYFFCLSPNSVV